MSEDEKAHVGNSDVPKAIGTPPVLWADVFRIFRKVDGLFLLDICGTVPEGLQINSRVMLTRDGVERLKRGLTEILDAPAQASELKKPINEPHHSPKEE